MIQKEDLLKLNNHRLLLPLNLQFFADEGGEKTEEPTTKRLNDARKEGQVCKSQELITAGMLFVLFLSLKLFSGYMADNLVKAFPESYNSMHVYVTELPSGNYARAVVRAALLRVLITCLPMFALAYLTALSINLFQVKWKPTAKPMVPKLSKISPLKGMKRLFSMDKLFELGKAILKIIFIFYIAYSNIIKEVDKIKIIYQLELWPAFIYITDLVVDIGLKIAMFYLLIGGADYLYRRWKFHKDMKMTKQEVKDEFKQQEGDPQVKGQIRSKMREVSRRRMMQKVPEADVVITNPTHYACAIKYDKEISEAPILLAKGADYLAQKIKEIARENNVPLYENKALARMLYYNVDLDSEIPEELYAMTAEVLAYVYGLKNKGTA